MNKWVRQTNVGRSYSALIATSNRFLKFHPIGRALTYTTNALLICVGLAGGWALGLQLVGNVHVVEPGVLYRSAQLNGRRLADVIDAYGIKSVINLRGKNSGSWWYDNEVEVTTAHGASHLDVRMSALRDPADATIAKLMETMRTAPRPILIHCQSGSDRTGLATALFERFVERRPANIAAHQISFRYGHFPWLGSRSIAMDRAFLRLSTSGLPEPEM